MSTVTVKPAAGAASMRPSIRVRLRRFGQQLLPAIRAINLTGLAAQVSYSMIFAMPSILLIVALLGTTIDASTGYSISDEVRLFILDGLPESVQPTVDSLVNDAMLRAREGPSLTSAVVAVLVTLLVAGNGLGELAGAFDRAAGIVDHRPFILQRLIFTASAVGIGIVLLLAFALYIWGGDLVELATERFHLSSEFSQGWDALQGPVILLLGFAAATFLYMTSSDRYHITEAAPGGLVATVIWLLLVKGFQVYLHFAN
ncbi:MAG: YihY/virulence factor BrkB family protein, partial [Chloroflexota bacterium]|nr:YihY/virulence factor BrkB family protein [Chloroflexota bacterium]